MGATGSNENEGNDAKENKTLKKNNNSSQNQSENSDEGAFGAKWRVYFIGILLGFCCILLMPMPSESIEAMNDVEQALEASCALYATLGTSCLAALEPYEDLKTALQLILAGVVLIFIACVVAVALRAFQDFGKVQDSQKNFLNIVNLCAALFLVIGAILYFAGTCLLADEGGAGGAAAASAALAAAYSSSYSTLGVSADVSSAYVALALGGPSGCDFDPDTWLSMQEMQPIAEGLLVTGTAVVLALDLWRPQYLAAYRTRVLAQSLVLMMLISVLCGIAYGYIGGACENGMDEIRTIAAGYFLTLIVGFVWLLMMFGECGQNATNGIVIVGLLLIAAAVVTAAGYWSGNMYDGADDYNSWTFAYTLLWIGTAVYMALDGGLVACCRQQMNGGDGGNKKDAAKTAK